MTRHMDVRAGILVGACVASLLLAGCDSKNKKAALTDEEIRQRTIALKPVRADALVVSGEAVTFDEIIAVSSPEEGESVPLRDKLVELAKGTTLPQFLELARPQIRQRLNNSITTVILYKRAKRQLGDKADEQLDKIVEKELRRFILEHGDNGAAADAALQEMGMSRQRFKEYRKKQILSQYYVTSKFPYNRPITHHEMIECYDRIKDRDFRQAGLVQFRLIDIQPAKVPRSGGNDDPIQAARNLAKDLMGKLQAGEDFAELAKKYSNDHRSSTGGLWPAVDPDSLAPPYDLLAARSRDMKVGEVAGPIETPEHVFIVKLEQKQEKGYRPYAEVQDQVEQQIKVDRRVQALDQLNEEVAKQVALADTSGFVDACLERLYKQAHGAPAVQ
jgi:parvulin-like peptidyl-prolyl isomerase